ADLSGKLVDIARELNGPRDTFDYLWRRITCAVSFDERSGQCGGALTPEAPLDRLCRASNHPVCRLRHDLPRRLRAQACGPGSGRSPLGNTTEDLGRRQGGLIAPSASYTTHDGCTRQQYSRVPLRCAWPAAQPAPLCALAHTQRFG